MSAGSAWAGRRGASRRADTPRTEKIADLEFFLVGGPQDEGGTRSLLVRLSTDGQGEGWGEALSRWQPDELELRREALLPVLAGRSVFDIEDLLQIEALKDRPLRSALEMACWDVVGRVCEQPLCHLWGGVYREHVPVATRVAGPDPEGLVQTARELAEQGFHTLYVSAVGEVAEDLRAVAAVRESVGERSELRLDGRCLYEPDAARELCRQLEPEGLELLIDPLASNDLSELAALGRQTNVALGVSRAVAGSRQMLAAVRSSAAAAVLVDLQRVGGLAEARRCAAVAAAGACPSAGAVDSGWGIAAAAMLQLAAATPSFSRANHCAFIEGKDDVLGERPEILDGMLTVPQGPGLGVEVDRVKVEARQVT